MAYEGMQPSMVENAVSRPQGRIDTINDEIQKLTALITQNMCRLREVNSRIFGADPEKIPTHEADSAPIMSHGVGYTEHLLTCMHSELRALSEQIERAEQL